MTIESGDSLLSPLGGEINFDRRKLESLLTKELKPLCAKLQWSPTDRAQIVKCLTPRKPADLRQLVELFGTAGTVGALFEVDACELFLAEYAVTGRLNLPVLSNENHESDPPRKRKKHDKDSLAPMLRQVYQHHQAVARSLLTRVDQGQIDSETLRWIVGLDGGKPADSVERVLAELADYRQAAWTNFHPDQRFTKLKLLSSDSSTSSFVTICGVSLRRGDAVLSAGDQLLPLSRRRAVLESLRCLAVGAASARPVLVVGECGSGKSHLVRYLAQSASHRLQTCQLSEETDAQSLLGSFEIE